MEVYHSCLNYLFVLQESRNPDGRFERVLTYLHRSRPGRTRNTGSRIRPLRRPRGRRLFRCAVMLERKMSLKTRTR